LSDELQKLSSVAQVFWEIILGLSTLLLLQFGSLVNPITRFLTSLLETCVQTQIGPFYLF